jgi:hypothetical protein
MANIYVAFQMGTGARLASGSQTTIKKKMASYPNTEWTVVPYEFKADVETLCNLLEFQVAGTPKNNGEQFKVTEAGTVRKV